jgi:hypothetical protein
VTATPPSPQTLEVDLPNSVLLRVLSHVGDDGRLWRARMILDVEQPLPVSVFEGGPWIDGRRVRVDSRLIRSACAALDTMAREAGPRAADVREDLAPLLDALVDAQARQMRR